MSDNDSDNKLDRLERLVSSDDTPNQITDFLEKHFNLPGNPFPPSGIADGSGDNPPLQEDIFDQVYEFISTGYSTKRRQFLVLRGDYGTGKTHTLHFIENVVNTRMSKGDRAARAVYVERPRIEAQELNRSILQSLGLDTVRKYTWFAIQQILTAEINSPSEEFNRLKKYLTTPKTKGQKRGSPNQQSLWNDSSLANLTPFDKVFSLEVILDYRTFIRELEIAGWSRQDIKPYLTNLLLKAVSADSPPSLVETFIVLLLAPDEDSFGTWETLVGASTSKTLTSLRAPTFLQFLLRLMEINGIVYVYLLLDEFEEVSQGYLLTPRQRQDYLYTLREVLNRIQKGLSIVLAVSPAGWDAIISIATPLADVNDELVELRRIDINDAIKLAEYYFKRERRMSDFASVLENDINPLNDGVIGFILDQFPKNVQRTPRNLIQFFYILINYVASQQITTITQKHLENLLDSFSSVKSTKSRQQRGRKVLPDATTD